MMKTTLVIMAAGLGSRFGEGLKQLAKVGPSGEIIMDYSIHDALEAGFDKIVFRASISINPTLPFIKAGDVVSVRYQENNGIYEISSLS